MTAITWHRCLGIQCNIWRRAQDSAQLVHELRGGGQHRTGYRALMWQSLLSSDYEGVLGVYEPLIWLPRKAAIFLFEYHDNDFRGKVPGMGLIQVGGNGACSSKKKDQHMPLRVPPSAGRAAAGCTNCSTIVVKLCSEVLIYLPQKFWLDENINLPRRSGLYPDYQPFRRQFSKVFVSLIRIRVDVVPPRR